MTSEECISTTESEDGRDMKVYISADIEGVAGITHWDEAAKSKSAYQEFREQISLGLVKLTPKVFCLKRMNILKS